MLIFVKERWKLSREVERKVKEGVSRLFIVGGLGLGEVLGVGFFYIRCS